MDASIRWPVRGPSGRSGFHYGSAILHFEATEDARCLDLARKATVERMTDHLTDFGVHDHGFNIVSTYGNLWRLAKEGRTPRATTRKFACTKWR